MNDDSLLAAITLTLRDRLQQAVSQALPGARVTTLHPARVHEEAAVLGLNLHLLQVQPSSAVRTAHLPTHDADKALRAPSDLVVDLDFLLTAHGPDAHLVPARLLEVALRTLHGAPLVRPDDVPDGAGLGAPVHLTRVPLTLDESARLWRSLEAPACLGSVWRVQGVHLGAENPNGG